MPTNSEGAPHAPAKLPSTDDLGRVGEALCRAARTAPEGVRFVHVHVTFDRAAGTTRARASVELPAGTPGTGEGP